MSKWTKGLFLVALGLLLYSLMDSSNLYLTLLASILYVVAGFISYNQDKQFKEIGKKYVNQK
jgi:hypothetical protein